MQNFSTNFNKTLETTIISNLTQNTQYAYYVKTQVVPKENEEMLNATSQGQSNIEYFETEAGIPTQPFVQTHSKTHNSLTLAWQPFYDTDLIEYYRLNYFIQPDEHAVLDARDYCQNPRIEVNTASETNEQHPSSKAKLSCNAEYDNWRLQNLDVEDPLSAWQELRKVECAARRTGITKGESSMQILKYIENYPLNLCDLLGGGKCAIQNDFESIGFSRQIHDFVMTSGSESSINGSSSNVTSVDEETNYGANYIGQMEFPNTVQKNTFDGLKPYTMYVFQFFSCFRPQNCSRYFLYYDRTDSSPKADDIDLNVTTDPYDTNRVYLNFDEPKQPNGLTVAFQIEKHDLSSFKLTTVCITRKQHFDNGKR